LETTAYSLTEIAYLTGFSDQSHFNRIFKKQMGNNRLRISQKPVKKVKSILLVKIRSILRF